MSLFTSLFTGVSGLNAAGVGLSVVGNNIANLNNPGFKASRTEFEEILAGSIANARMGGGVNVSAITGLFSQGTLETTGSPTDLGIAGDGFFVISNGARDFYTRSGQFTLNADGDLVNPAGLFLQGWETDATGVATSLPGNINLEGRTSPAQPTSTVDIRLNLDAGEDVRAAFNPANPGETSNFSNTITVYDSQGSAHSLTTYFRKSAANNWEYHIIADGGDTEINPPGGTLLFRPTGELDTQTGGPFPIQFDPGVTLQSITFDFTGATQFGSPSAVQFQTQDGYKNGVLSNISIDRDGFVWGTFTNGQSIRLNQVMLARFNNPNGLERLGGNLFSANSVSGESIIGEPNTGGRGNIVSSSLEQSNVDLASEFVRMITLQRSFQANSRTISSTNQLLQELINVIT